MTEHVSASFWASRQQINEYKNKFLTKNDVGDIYIVFLKQ